METKELLMKLSNIDGISGREGEVSKFLMDYVQGKSEIDDFGNVYFGNLQTDKRKICIYSHLDEVGFLVKHITSDGFIYFQPIGSWWGHVMLGQKVKITARKNGHVYEGIIGTLPENSVMTEKIVPIEKMYIDVGATDREEIEAIGIQIGDMITPAVEAKETFNGRYVTGKALDNRVGCCVMAEVFNHLSGKLHAVEMIGVATAQEEVGTRGSKIAGAKVQGDINIILDVANGKDTPKAAFYKSRVLGDGPGLVVSDKTALGDIRLLDFVKGAAEECGIPYQYDFFGGGGTDAGSVQLASGKPTLVISIPVRYCHSWNALVHISDCEGAIQLLVAVIEELERRGGEIE